MSGEAGRLDDALRRYIVTSVPSVPYLEALLLMRGEPAQTWPAATLAARLYVPEPRARELVQQLQEAGLAQPGEGGHRYAPATEALRNLADGIAAAYLRDLPGISQLIHGRKDSRAAQFAEAFRMRKDT